MKRNTFKKEERLKSKKLIENLFSNGKVIHHFPFKVLYVYTKDSSFIFPAKIALAVSKKSFKNAVDRNQIKRRIREAYRLNKSYLYDKLNLNNQNLYFFVIYTAKTDIEFKELDKAMASLLKKLG